MIVELIKKYTLPGYTKVIPKGREIEVTDELGKEWIKAGIAKKSAKSITAFDLIKKRAEEEE